MITLEEPFHFNQFVQPACLPSKDEKVSNGTMLMVSGFGDLSDGGRRPTKLQYAQIPMVDHETCARLYDKNNQSIMEDMMCAGFLTGGKDSCTGDSGGPLVHISKGERGNAKAVLMGIVSWAEDCAKPNFPGVNSDVRYIVDWIIDAVNKSNYDEVESPFSFEDQYYIKFQNSKCQEYMQSNPIPQNIAPPGFLGYVFAKGDINNVAHLSRGSTISFLLVPLLTVVFVV